MKKDKEWIGEWYIPVKDEVIVFYGTLSYSMKNGIILKASCDKNLQLVNNFLDEVIEDSYEFVNGMEHKSNMPLTLYKCDKKNISSQEGIVLTMRVAFVFESIEYSTETSLFFKSLLFEFSGLGEWLKLRGLVFSQQQISENHLFNIDYFRPEKLLFNVNEDFDLEIIFSYQTRSDDRFEFAFTEIFFGHIIYKKGFASFDSFMRILEVFRRLMSVLMDYECSPIDMRLFSPINDDINDEFKKSKGFQVFYKPPFISFPISKISWTDMYFTFEDLQDNFELILKKWFSYINKDDIDYVHWILSGLPKSFSEDVFLSKARALEVFHRATSNKVLFSEEKKNGIISKMVNKIVLIDIIDVDFQGNENEANKILQKTLKKISNSLNYINEPSFRERLKELVNHIKAKSDPSLFKRMLANSDSLISHTVSKRNYFTHYGDEKEEKEYNSEDYLKEIVKLHKLTIRLKHLLLVLVLENLGVDVNKTIEKIINGKYRKYYGG